MALDGPQKAKCRQYLGWAFGFNDSDSHLEQSFSGLETKPDEELLITDTLANGGVLASLADIDAKLILAHKRLKASKVGDIVLNRMEVRDLCKEGNRFVARLARMLGVPVRDGGGFSTAAPSGSSTRGGHYPGNYVGK